MPTTVKLRNKLLSKLKELFQLDKPDLDFGFYRVMHAKAKQVEAFVEKDLLKIIEDAFGQVDEGRKAELQANIEKEITAAKEYGVAEPENSPKVKEAKAKYEALKDTVTAEADVYDHLYRFFERYYDDGDFISRRYYTRENSGKAAPFAIPYNGEEVKLHWANADQYYIKTAEYFSNFTFDITQAAEIRKMSDEEKILKGITKTGLKIHFRIVDATEGEHGNIKETDDKKRFFVLHEDKPVEIAAGANNDSPELVVNFEYKSLPGGKNDVDELTEEALKEKYGKSLNKGDMPNLAMANRVINAVQELITRETHEDHDLFLPCLELPSPTDKISNRPLLAKYINQYTSRNTCDYFIHKDLGGFLKRELDFYIKNEVMHLDDIENADVPVVESYLAKLKVIRKIATKLIEFLAQLEDFQKKLWLKKKFVVDTNYCITLDRVPHELYPEIAANDAQREEWVKLFAIDEIKGNDELIPGMKTPGYSVPLTIDFLKVNDKLVLDTAFFSEDFKARLIASINDFDEKCDGLLIHSENFHALNLLQERYREQVKCVHIDPPYNTASSGFLYKNSYEHSSWMSLMNDRILSSINLVKNSGVFSCHIDEYEMERLHLILEQTSLTNSGTLVWDKGMPIAGANGLATQHEYVLFRTKGQTFIKVKKKNIELINNKVRELLKTYGSPTKDAISDYRKWLREQSKLSKAEKTYDQFDISGKAFRSDNMSATDKRTHEKFYVPLIHPTTGVNCPVPSYGWRYTPESMQKLLGEGYILFGEDHTSMPRKKTYLENTSDSQMSSIFTSGQRGKIFLDNLGLEFPFAHAIDYYSYIIDSCIDQTDTVIDYFGGSGTTAHSIISLNREDSGKRKYLMCEMGRHFDTVLKPRIIKAVYSDSWKDGKPTSKDTGISHCFKYLRLESYEDTLNNLVFDNNETREDVINKNDSLREDYMLHYLLDVETRGSQTLLNIDNFIDPTSYTLKIKRPGSDEQITKNVDLIETFNYLIGLRLENMAAPQTFTASFTRKPDPELPEDQHTKLIVKDKIRPDEKGKWWFRKVDGWVPAAPMNPNNGQKEKVLIVWRKLTGNLEEDNLMLDEWFKKFRINSLDFEYDTIYVNGSNNLPNLRKDDEHWKVRLIEEEFHKRMWETE